MARGALEAHMAGAAAPPVPDTPACRARHGAFVTLRRAGELRGCIGHIPADRSLADTVARMAVAAATEDPRFPPVAPEELAELRIEVSVLSEPTRLTSSDPAGIRAGQDGVIVRRGGHQGLLLPQVATEFAWDAEALLAAACQKAGLRPDAWRETDTELYVFQVEAFGE
ncbi:MAG: AmmeMemoRadiSam system protein A [Gemmatimonadales bacterium]